MSIRLLVTSLVALSMSACAPASTPDSSKSIFKVWYNPRTVDGDNVQTSAYLTFSGTLTDANAQVAYGNGGSWTYCNCDATLIGGETAGYVIFSACSAYPANRTSTCSAIHGRHTSYKSSGAYLFLGQKSEETWQAQ